MALGGPSLPPSLTGDFQVIIYAQLSVTSFMNSDPSILNLE